MDECRLGIAWDLVYNHSKESGRRNKIDMCEDEWEGQMTDQFSSAIYSLWLGI